MDAFKPFMGAITKNDLTSKQNQQDTMKLNNLFQWAKARHTSQGGAASAVLMLMIILAPVLGHAATVKGRVLDRNSGAALAGVRVVGPGDSTTTNRFGEYMLENLDNGSQDILFRYGGYNDVTRQVELREGEIFQLDLGLAGDVVTLEAFTIEERALGQARAINLQRNADHRVDIVAADALGRFPDQNAAEAVARLPGVSIERDQGEGRFVIIRGIDPNLNAVAIDGVSLAAPNTGDRATLLDTIPSETLQSVEVSKAPLPSMPGDGIGGYINIKTPSAFDSDGMTARATVQGVYTELTEEWGGKVNAAWGDTFANEKIGFILSASYENRSFGSDNREAEPLELEEGAGGQEFWVQTDEIQFREYDLTRERLGLNFNLEYKTDADTMYFLRSSFSRYTDVEIRHRGILAFGEEDDDDEDLTEYTTVSNEPVAENIALAREIKDREENMTIWTTTAGGNLTFGEWDFDFSLSYSFGEEDTPYDTEMIYELINDDPAEKTQNPDVRLSNLRSDFPQVTFFDATGDGIDPFDPDSYEFDKIEDANQISEESHYAGQFNVARNFSEGTLSAIKFGGLYRDKTKESDLEVFESDDNPGEVDTLAGMLNRGQRDPYGSGLPYINEDFRDYFSANRADFAMERNEEDSTLEDFESTEEVIAAYVQAEFKTDRASAIIGIRAEQTDFSSTGWEFDADDETFARFTGSNEYTNFLPGVHTRFNLTDSLILRASWNQSIARPSFEQTFAGRTVIASDEEVEAGNPELDPYKANNYDFTLEYYMKSLGTISVSLFYKDVENFIYEQTVKDGINIDGTDMDLITFRNGPSGEILGLELAYQQQFSFLPGPLGGLGFYANLTFTESEADILAPETGGESRTVDFLKQSGTIGNVALTYDMYGFFFRIAGSFRSEYLDELGEEQFEDRYMDEHFQVDISSSYKINDNLTIFANAINLTDEPLRAFFDQSNGLAQFEEYGVSYQFGLKYNY